MTKLTASNVASAVRNFIRNGEQGRANELASRYVWEESKTDLAAMRRMGRLSTEGIEMRGANWVERAYKNEELKTLRRLFGQA